MSTRNMWLAALLLVVVCTPQPANSQSKRDYAASRNPHIRLFAYLLKDAVWPSPRVYVCWENVASETTADAAFVQKTIEDTWQKESALQFIGWQPCAAESEGIRIRIEDTGPHTLGLGQATDDKVNRMVLNFTFQKWGRDCANEREYCIKTMAVHEFGHAIGFAHEQNRHDAPGECRALKQGTDGTLPLTPYDKDSVMNYCNPKYNNDGELSVLDKQAVREVYGAAIKPTPAN